MRQQENAFTKFVNSTLAQGGYPIVNDIVVDMKDGIYLCNFLMCLKIKAGKTKKGSGGTLDMLLKEPKPKNRFACYTNLNGALEFVKADGINLVNIGAEDLYDGSKKLVLGLIFTLTLSYLSGGGSKVEKELIDWVNKILDEHKPEFGVERIKNFENEPQIGNGTMFKVLNHHFADDKDRDKLSTFEKTPSDKVKHFDDALKDGHDVHDIPVLLEGKDMDQPDPKAVMMQVLQYKQLDNKQSQSEYLKDQLNKKLQKALEAKKKAQEINYKIDDLRTWVQERTKQLDDSPDDLHPDKIPEMESFVDNHFSNDKPEKNEKYKQIAADVAKLKSECMANKITVPKTGMSDLNADWAKLTKSERAKIQYISKMKAIYGKLATTHRRFLRKLATCHKNAQDVKEGSDDVSEKSKNATITTLDETEIILDGVDAKLGMAEEEQKDLHDFTDRKIKSVCPNAQYFEEKFGNPLKDCDGKMQESDGACKKAHSDLDEAKNRLHKVKNNLRENAKVLAAVNKQIEQAKVLANEDTKFDYIENLNDFADELAACKPDGMRSDLNACKARDDANAQIAGRPVENPYTKLQVEPLQNETNQLENDLKAKVDSLQGERERLQKLAAKYDDFNKKKDHINGLLDEINRKIEDLNASSEANDIIKGKLQALSLEIEAVGPKVDQLQGDVSDVPDLVNECRGLTTRCDEALTTIKQQINILDSKPEITDDTIELTDDEIKKIKSNFASNDVDKQGKLTYMQFTSVAIAFTPLGINNITEASSELKTFFSQYSKDKSTINVEELLQGYKAYKADFAAKNKDTVNKLLSDKADSEGHVSEDDLKATVSPKIFADIQSLVQPIDKDGKKFYALNEIL